MTLNLRSCILAAVHAFAVCSVAVAQVLATEEAEPAISEPAPAVSAAPIALPTGCNLWRTITLSTTVSFGQRVCIGLSELASPGVLAGSALIAGISQWRNNPHMNQNDGDDFGVRFEHLYERRTARITAETLVGAWHHEDPRLRSSGAKSPWRRTGAALLSVLDSPDQDGHARIALAPLAGSLGSGLTSMALYQRQNSIGWGLERSALIYTHYFVRALYHEFSPELWSLAPSFMRKYHTKNLPVDY